MSAPLRIAWFKRDLARQRISAARRGADAREQSQSILAKHGSRKGAPRRRPKRVDDAQQGKLFD